MYIYVYVNEFNCLLMSEINNTNNEQLEDGFFSHHSH